MRRFRQRRPSGSWRTLPPSSHDLVDRKDAAGILPERPGGGNMYRCLKIRSRPMPQISGCRRGPGTAPAWLLSYVRSEEHTSELQSHLNLVCRLLLEKKKILLSM